MNKSEFEGIMRLVKVDMNMYNEVITQRLKKIEYCLVLNNSQKNNLIKERDELKRLQEEVFQKYIKK